MGSDTFESRSIFAITNPNKGWVESELERLRREWADWKKAAKVLAESPDSADYDRNTCSEAIKDGFEKRREHQVLREKTLIFIRNNFDGATFLFEDWPHHPHEDITSRLVDIVPAWIQRLDILAAGVSYARVPDGFWKAQGKKLVDKIAAVAPDKAVDIAASWLRNPLGEN